MHPACVLSPVATRGGVTHRGPARGCVRQVSARSAVGWAAPREPRPPPVATRGRFRARPRVRRAPLARAASADAEPRASEPGASPGGDGGSPEADDDHDDHAGDIEIPEKPKHVRVVDGFLPPDPSAPGSALGLRAVFDAHHDDPRRTHAYRFVWDYWHVPNQYTLLRTPAADYFPERDFAALERRLGAFARDELGCAGVTPVWLSCYVEGMRQELHADVPHGPWAFVLSLTRWDERTWTGGETLILKPSTLDYWSSFDADATVERESLVELVPPRFNRLTVFDPRLPHGVPVVEGVRDPSQGRLVLHGWFNEPEPSLRGALADRNCRLNTHPTTRQGARGEDDDDDDDARRSLKKKTRAYAELSEDRPNEDEALDFRYYANTGDAASEARTFEVLGEDVLPDLYATLATLPRARGTVVLAATLEADGACSKTEWTADALVPAPVAVSGGEFSASETRDAIMLEIAAAFLSHEGWPRSGGKSRLVVPFMFD